MTLKESARRVELLKRFISLLWIGDTSALELAYKSLEEAEEDYQELAFGGVLSENN